MKKISYISCLILFFLLPFVHAKLGGSFGFNEWYFVDGNFEFTKSIFFNILSGIIILFYIIENKYIKLSPIAFGGLLLLIIHLVYQYIFGNFFYTSLLGSPEKGHGIILFINLILLSQILLAYTKDQKKILLYIIFTGSILVNILALKEFFIPSFDYNDLANRALGSFGHPNYLAFYNIIILLLLFRQKLDNNWSTDTIIILSIFLSIFTLIYTKSALGIGIFSLYFLYRSFIHFRQNYKKGQQLLIITAIGMIIGGALIYVFIDFGILSKLNSFISRFYIWESALRAVFDSNIILGIGPDSLSYIFDNYKNTKLYIFENIGYTADRPHNIFIYTLVSFGILGLLAFVGSIYSLIKNRTLFEYFHIIIIALIFLSFNFASITGYILIIFVLSFYKHPMTLTKTKAQKYTQKIALFIPLIILLFSFMQMVHNFYYYSEEHRYYTTSEYDSSYRFVQMLRYENPEKNIFHSAHSNQEVCATLLNDIPSVENYFFCGKIFTDLSPELSLDYYKKGLDILPDMWNTDSQYYDDFLIKRLYSEKRFYSEKYSDIKNILEVTNK